MNSLPEQFQAARQTQLDNQFRLLRLVTDGMLDRTGRLLALQLDTTRAAVEHSSSAMRQLLALRDPRDLMNIGAQAQHQLRSMFDYGRELFSITTGLRGIGLQTYSVDASAPALAAPAAAETAPLKEAEIVADATAAVSASVEEVFTGTARAGDTAAESASAAAAEAAVAPATASVTASATAPVTAPAAAPSTEPAPEAPSVSVCAAEIEPDTTPVVSSTIAPPVEPTPIARATSEVLDMPLAPPHPVAASLPVEVAVEIEVPKVEPVNAVPPVVVPAGNGPKVTEIRSGRGRKKQS